MPRNPLPDYPRPIHPLPPPPPRIFRDTLWGSGETPESRRAIQEWREWMNQHRSELAAAITGAPRMNKKLVDLIKKHFRARLETKTGWGRNDLWHEFEAAINDALLEYLDDA